jgi:hypothetical protein
MDEVRRGACSVRVRLQVSTCTVIPADLVSLHVGGGRPPLVAAPCRPQGNKFRGTLEDLSDAKFERWVVTEMSIGQPKTHDDLARVPVLDNTGDGRGRTSSRLTCLAGLHVASLACASRHQNAAITGLRPLLANSNRRSSRQMRSFSITGLARSAACSLRSRTTSLRARAGRAWRPYGRGGRARPELAEQPELVAEEPRLGDQAMLKPSDAGLKHLPPPRR